MNDLNKLAFIALLYCRTASLAEKKNELFQIAQARSDERRRN
jgi:hypothetical protein